MSMKFLNSLIAIMCLIFFIGISTPSTYASDTDNKDNTDKTENKDQSKEDELMLPKCPPNC